MLARLAPRRFERDDDVPERVADGVERSLAKREGEHVGGTILVPVAAVEVADLVVADERHAQLRAAETEHLKSGPRRAAEPPPVDPPRGGRSRHEHRHWHPPRDPPLPPPPLSRRP